VERNAGDQIKFYINFEEVEKSRRADECHHAAFTKEGAAVQEFLGINPRRGEQ
jgi:hypothetical protein